MTTGEDRKKDRFENWKHSCLWKLPFRHHWAIKLTQNRVCMPVRVSTSLFWLPSLVNTTPSSGVQRGAGRRPRASKAGEHPKS